MGCNAPIRVTWFVLLAACAAWCQQGAEKVAVAFSALPDAPSVQAAARAEGLRGDEAATTLMASTDTGVVSAAELASGTRAPQMGELVFKAEPAQKESGDFFEKYLYPSLLKRNLSYHPSTSSSLMGRATYAASRVFITRDASGKGRVNTSYFLGLLSSAAVHMAYRPYWARSASTPFSNFGSTIGNDAGMNVLHEFGPGLEQMMRSHTPKFVSKIQQRIGR
jgi:hypothetical protein